MGAGSCLESSLACGSQGHRPGLRACVSLSVGKGGGWGLPGAQAKIITREREELRKRLRLGKGCPCGW